MNKNFILSPLVIALGAMVWVSAAGGVAQVQNKDRTGSPVSAQACNMCHVSGISYGTIATITVKDSNGVAVTEYVPGDLYTLTVGVQSNGDSGHGFQITGLLDDNSAGGICNPISTNTQKTNLNDRWYFEQSSLLTGGVYEMEWFAPQPGHGNVTFYGSVLATNGNGITSGDDYEDIPSLLIKEAGTTGIADLSNKMDVKVYPNPVKANLNVSIGNEEIDKIEVFDITGTLVLSKNVNASKTQLQLNEFRSGNYVVKVTSGKDVKTVTVIKN